MPFNQSLTIPLDLKLTATADGPRMTFTPVKELEALRVRTHRIPVTTLKPGDKNPLDDIRSELVWRFTSCVRLGMLTKFLKTLQCGHLYRPPGSYYRSG
jgi:hypothetical protein